jgi:hypothetical protein
VPPSLVVHPLLPIRSDTGARRSNLRTPARHGESCSAGNQDAVSMEGHLARLDRKMGLKGRVIGGYPSLGREIWKSCTALEPLQAILDLRELYHEEMHPEIGAKGLDQTTGGARSRGG